MGQLDLNFIYISTVAAPAAPVTVASQPSITRTPSGFRVVLAPGLTSKSAVNPCAECSEGQDRDSCSEFCSKEKARLEYLETIGVAGLITGDCEGDYSGSQGFTNDMRGNNGRANVLRPTY